MRTIRLLPILTLLHLLIAGGCVTPQLRRSTVAQAGSLTNIYEQQVLDNLAMFVCEPDSVPFFATPAAGGAVVQNSGSAGADFNFRGPFFTKGGSSASGSITQNWTISAVTSSDRIRLMQLAYQRAVGLETIAGEPDLDENPALGRIESIKIESIEKRRFDRKCEKVGTYCGRSYRVCPESQEAFSRLVMVILHFANDPVWEKPKKPKTSMLVQQFEYKDDKVSAVITYRVDETGAMTAVSDDVNNLASPVLLDGPEKIRALQDIQQFQQLLPNRGFFDR